MWKIVGACAYLVIGVVVLRHWVLRSRMLDGMPNTFHVEHRRTWSVAGALGILDVVAMFARHGTAERDLVLVWVLVLPVLVTLAVVDVGAHRLPDPLTSMAALATLSGALGVEWQRDECDTSFAGDAAGPGLVGVFLGAGALALVYFVLCLLSSGRGMGLGDVKLTPALGMFAAAFGVDRWIGALVLPFLLGGAWGVWLLMRGRGASARMPFGPFMISGTALSLMA